MILKPAFHNSCVYFYLRVFSHLGYCSNFYFKWLELTPCQLFIPINCNLCNLVEMFITLFMSIKPRYIDPCGILQKSKMILLICKSYLLETKILVFSVCRGVNQPTPLLKQITPFDWSPICYYCENSQIALP